MTRPPPERFYELLPAFYRQRDVEQGEPLRALMAVLEQEYERIRTNVETTFDNWFIETCERWLVPYIGALVGVESDQVDPLGSRAFVANSIAYRRRRGTALVLEQLAQDLTGYRVRAVEYFDRVHTHVHMQHVRERKAMPALGGTVDLRDAARLERFDGPFDRQAHRVDVRRAASGRGRYNIPNLGLHLWRIGSVEITRSQAAPIPGEPNFFRFDPWGRDAPLYNVPRTEAEISSLAEEVNLPLPLRRRELAADLDRDVPLYLGDDPVFVVRLARDGVLESPLSPVICNLAGDPGSLPAARPAAGEVAVDPELGRLVLHDDDLAGPGTVEVMVDYAFGSAGPLGAGPWDRSASLNRQLGETIVGWRRYVTRNPILLAALAGSVDQTLDAAIGAWNTHVAAAGVQAVGMIIVLGGRSVPHGSGEIEPESRIWAAPSETIELPRAARLHLIAAGIEELVGSPPRAIARNTRALIVGDLAVVGDTDDQALRPGGLFLNGIGLTGTLAVAAGRLEALDLAYCTVSPSAGGIDIASALGQQNSALALTLERTLCGPIGATAAITSLTAIDSLVQAGGAAIQLAGAASRFEGSTILGTTDCRTVSANDSIFAGALTAEQHQQGCVRFCYLAPGGRTPRPFRCQPRLALEGLSDPAAQAAVRRRVQPNHVSLELGDPGYGLLHPNAPIELHTGAEDGSAMGVFHHLQHAQREARLRRTLERYLRFGLEAGLFIES